MPEGTTLESNPNFVAGERTSRKDKWLPMFCAGSGVGTKPVMYGLEALGEDGRPTVELIMTGTNVEKFGVVEKGGRVEEKYFDTGCARQEINSTEKKSLVAAGLFLGETIATAWACNLELWGNLPVSWQVEAIIDVATIIGMSLIIYGTLVYLNENSMKLERLDRWINRAQELGGSTLARVVLARENWEQMEPNGTNNQKVKKPVRKDR